MRDAWSERRGLVLAGAAAGAAGALWLVRRASAADAAPAGRTATSFDAYLKDRSVGAAKAAPTYAATSFEAYLRQPDPAAAAAAVDAPAAGERAAAAAAAPPDAKPLTVLYGTEYGFSKEVAEKACEALKAAGYWPQLADMAALPRGLPGLGDAGRHQALLLVCSTQARTCWGCVGACMSHECAWRAARCQPQTSTAALGLAPTAHPHPTPGNVRRATACLPPRPANSAIGCLRARRRAWAASPSLSARWGTSESVGCGQAGRSVG